MFLLQGVADKTAKLLRKKVFKKKNSERFFFINYKKQGFYKAEK